MPSGHMLSVVVLVACERISMKPNNIMVWENSRADPEFGERGGTKFLQIHAITWHFGGRIFMLLWFSVSFEFKILPLALFFAVCSGSLGK